MSFFESESWRDFIEGTMPALVRELRDMNKRAQSKEPRVGIRMQPFEDTPAPPAAPVSPEEAQKQDRAARAAEDAMRATIARMKVEADEAQKVIEDQREQIEHLSGAHARLLQEFNVYKAGGR